MVKRCVGHDLIAAAALGCCLVGCNDGDANNLSAEVGPLPADCAALKEAPPPESSPYTPPFDLAWTMGGSAFNGNSAGTPEFDAERPWVRAGGWGEGFFEVFHGADKTDLSLLGATPLPLDFGAILVEHWLDDNYQRQILCFGAGTIVRSEVAELEIHSSAMQILDLAARPAAAMPPGQPVDGELILCGDGVDCATPFSGHLDGQAFESFNFTLKPGQGLDENYAVLGDDFLLLIEPTQGEFESDENAGNVYATMVTFPDSLLGPAVYTADDSSSWNLLEGGMKFTLQGFRKLGSCNPDTGEESLLVCGDYSAD